MENEAKKVSACVSVAVGALAFMLLIGASTALAQASSGGAGALVDLAPDTVQPTDGATAQVSITEAGGSTTVSLNVARLHVDNAGMMLGAHLHVGPCVAGNGAAAGPHYNSTGQVAVNNTTEVWLDFVVGGDATGSALAVVPFIIPPGEVNSLVIHEMSTAPNGGAGARWACLPVVIGASTPPAAPAPAVTPPAPAETTLAVTGTETGYLTALGFGLITVGAGLVAHKRRVESLQAD